MAKNKTTAAKNPDFKNAQRQGEVLFIPVEDFNDDDANYKAVPLENGSLIVAHSETGHHHVIEKPKTSQAQLLISNTNALMGRLVVDGKDGANVKHLRSFDTHNTVKLPKGKYLVRYAREHSPEGIRRVLD